MSTCGHPSFRPPPPLLPSLLSSSIAHSPSSDGGSLRSQHSFSSKVDEGYSGDETQTPSSSYEDSGMRDRMHDVKIPAWMTGLSAELREGGLYRRFSFSLSVLHFSSLFFAFLLFPLSLLSFPFPVIFNADAIQSTPTS